MERQDPFCLMPWIHFHVADHGQVNACCVAKIPYGNINKESFDEIWNGDSIQQLRKKFLRGEADNRCAQCTRLENSGGKSIRQETFEKFPHVKPQSTKVNRPIYFDIRFSNACNLKCRTCWHGASSSWFVEAKKLGTNASSQALIQNVGNFESFIGQLGSSLSQAEEIYFAGGEPLVTEEHYLILNHLISTNNTKVRLRYNTNFTNLRFKDYDLLQLWSKFERVDLLLSLDATGELGEYIRKGLKWSQIKENLNSLKGLPQVNLHLSPTISAMNLPAIPELYREMILNGPIEAKNIYFNILERPNHYNIQILPKPVKLKITQDFEKFVQQELIGIKHEKAIAGFKEIIQYLNHQDRSNLWTKFQQKNKELDELRDEKWTMVDPY